MLESLAKLSNNLVMSHTAKVFKGSHRLKNDLRRFQKISNVEKYPDEPSLSLLFNFDFILNTEFHSDKAFYIRQRNTIIGVKS